MTSLYPMFDESLPSADRFDGSYLSHALNKLDRVAAADGLVPLSSFIDARTIALEVLEEDQLPRNCPPVRWYSAQEGLITVQGLFLHYHQLPEASLEFEAGLVVELEHLESLLKEAETEDARFHLLVEI